jgi:murein DD-endopeptidase MepM/ murein hydrolase activator NlpD
MKKPSPFRYLLLIFPLIAVLALAYFIYNQFARMSGQPELALPVQGEVTPSAEADLSLYQLAVDSAVNALKQTDPGFLLYQPRVTSVETSADGAKALIWLESLDPETGEVMAREPELAVADINPDGAKGTPAEWKITLPYDAGYNDSLLSITGALLNEDGVQRYQKQISEPKVTAKFGGYYLPWAAGLSKKLTWSISHTSCANNACYYAFDFADGTMFPLLAAKGGKVFAANWTCNNGSTDCTNYLILQDDSTTPTTYQIYYHLANSSIPAALRVKGAQVSRGQFIGNVDDTGASTAHHLHFMVHASTYGYWGQSVDITFRDVSINYDPVTQGGRPRLPSEATQYGGQGQYSYISGNIPANAPTGSLSQPQDGAVFTSNTLVIAGTAQDDNKIAKIQPLAYYSDAWHEIGQAASASPFSISIDMCAASAQLPDGPIGIAVAIYDVDGNQSYNLTGFRGITKSYSCGQTVVPPPCTVTEGQVGFFSQPNYAGVCKVYNAVDIATRGSMGGFSGYDAASVLVGSNAQLTIWGKDSYTGRAETFTSSDPNLRDNLINQGVFSSFKVRAKSNAPTAPSLVYPASGAAFTTNDSLILSWVNRGWADEFRVVLSGINGFVTRTTDWMPDQAWNPGNLPAGSYTWQVTARNTANGLSSAAVSGTFTITTAASPAAAAFTAPWTDTVESGQNGWIATGLWKQTTAKASSPTHSWNYGETVSSVNQYATGARGTLTSAGIVITDGGYYLKFNYRYKTESSQRFFDQRWVQISKDGGPFENLYQLTDDPSGYWLSSPAISLQNYAGSTVRLRFFFDTVDTHLNTGDGWFVDNISVDTSGPATGCNEPVNNATPAQATALTIGGSAAGDICAAGDVDYFKVTVTAGQTLTFDVDAKTVGSALDPYLFLLDPTGKTTLAESDDEVAFKVKDSLLYYTFPQAGTYLLKLKAWDHPMVGGSEYFYILRVYTDTTAPTATMIYPTSGTLLPNAPVAIRVSPADEEGGSGISHINFFWHDHIWASGKWEAIGEDWDGSDGWSVSFDPTAEAAGTKGAIFAQVFDGSGNRGSAVSWNIGTDPTQAAPVLPATSLLALPATSDINAVLLQWNVVDASHTLAGYEFQVQENSGSWVDWQPEGGIQPSARYAWFIGTPGNTYGFRMRAVDAANGKEDYPTAAEASVALDACSSASDTSEPDGVNTAHQALVVNNPRIDRVFCGQMDEDWYDFTATAGEMYFINGLPLSPAAGVVITLFDAGGVPLAEKFPVELGAPSALRWIAPATGTYTIRMRNYNPLLAGDGLDYQAWVDQGVQYYVPMINP